MAITAYSTTCPDINRFGGISKVWVADKDDVAVDDFTISGGQITAISSIDDFSLITGDVFAAQWTTTDELQDSNNRLITNTLTLELPNLTTTQRDLIVELRNACGLRILIKDQGDSSTTHRSWVLGSEEDLYMRLSNVEGDSGRQVEDAKMATLTFVGKATLPAYQYTGADPA